MANAALPLLETKLHPPRRREAVARPRLRARLDRRAQPRLTLVSAPAGFGKTTLVTEWFANGPTTAWLSLDRRDNDAIVFWTYVVAALRTVTPDALASTEALLATPQTTLDALVATLLNDLHALDHDVVLVLDDYHVIESVDIHDTMTLLIEHLPPQVHLVIASRADPPFPVAAWRARGDLLEIRAADLRFTTDEAAAYLNDVMDLALASPDISTLEARTEGWIAALQLAALSLQGRADPTGFIAEFAGDDRFILDYLVGEVLDRQPPDVRTFLLETSILNRLTGPLCDAVTGQTGGTATLELLDRANLFVVPLDDRRTWYRYHHLFADVLRVRLLEEHSGRVADLRRRASDWLDEHDDRAEAIAHALAANDAERAARLIELAAPSMRQQRREAGLREWLEALPSGIFENRPVLTISLVGARMATGDATDVEPLLQLVEAALARSAEEPIVFDRDELSRLPAQLAVYRAGLALLTGDLDATVTHASRVLELAEPTDHLRHGSANALLGLALWASGDLRSAEHRYADAVDRLIAAGHLSDALGCLLALADIQLAQGRIGDASRTLETGLRRAAAHPGLRGAADMHVGLADLLIERNDLEAAVRHLEAAAELGERAGLPQNAYRRRVAAARLAQAQGDLDGALALLEEAEIHFNTDFSPPVRPVTALEARVQLARGDVAAALRWAGDRGLTPTDRLTYVREFEHITLARTLLAQHAASHDPAVLADASDLLRRLLAAAEDGQRAGSAAEILVLQAAALCAAGDDAAALAALEEALRRAEPERSIRVFVDAGPAVADLLRSTPPSEVAPRLLRRVRDALEPARSPSPSPSPLVDELSARERQVLRLLRSDLSGPEIAGELLVSLNTFRTHTKNIYAKLGVSNRREAVRRAAELGL